MPSTASGQSLNASEDHHNLFPAPAEIGTDIAYVVQSPLRMQRADYLTAIGLAGLTAGIVSTLDRPVHHAAHGPGETSPPLPHHLSTLGRAYDQIGTMNAVLGTAGVFAASGLIARNQRLARTSVNIAEAVLLTHLVTGVAKQTIGRSRPYTANGPYAADALDFGVGHAERSMPSGHTSKIFALASVIAHDYEAGWVKAAAYGTAASAGIQRIESGKHWLSDVFVGALLGYVVGRSVSNASLNASSTNRRVSYQPVISTNRVGLTIQF